MAFDWQDYLRLAKRMAGQSSDPTPEADARCIVSRAYFAAFGYARNWARDVQGFMPQASDDDHSKVREHFKMRRRANIAAKLDTLRKLRNQCDYEDVLPNVASMAQDAIDEADSLFAALPWPSPRQ